MQSTPPLPQESARLAELLSLELLDTPAEERFDRITRLAACVFQVPIAYIALIDEDRQWFKSKCGITADETGREISFCSHTIAQDDLLVVPDARQDERFHDNPLVTGEPKIVFYAGHPLRGPAAHNVGTLCVADTSPRDLSENHEQCLRELAALAERELQLLDVIDAQQQLIASQQKLAEEVNAAADYVQSLLPQRLVDEVTTDWAFFGSSRLGGDLFGYHWLESGKLAIYLFDVCGHGVGASLLSVSVFETLRQESLHETDFDRPGHVLAELNAAFPMERHGDRFFTIWYGVYDPLGRTLRYANAGHPPAILMRAGKPPLQMTESSMMIGVDPEAAFGESSARLQPGTRLYLFSDGAFEVDSPAGEYFGLGRLVESIGDAQQKSRGRVNAVWDEICQWQQSNQPTDDFSLLEVEFR